MGLHAERNARKLRVTDEVTAPEQERHQAAMARLGSECCWSSTCSREDRWR